MRPCQEARECGRTVTCVTIEGASPAGSYCVGDAEPGRCGEGCATLPTGASSCDGDILVSPYALDVCGFERVRCANGCGVLGLDGGSGAACL
jgi:hypothetical protein